MRSSRSSGMTKSSQAKQKYENVLEFESGRIKERKNEPGSKSIVSFKTKAH